ncbi:MAG: RsbRD N-terminal domain-containing protein [Anaeromyxobacter sp.]
MPDTEPLNDPLADFLRARRDEVVERWARRVRALPSARLLPEPALRDHVPHILERIEAYLAAQVGRDEVAARAEPHGQDRASQGYDLEELILEIGVLRDVVLEVRAEAGALTGEDAVRMVRAFDPVVASVVQEWSRAGGELGEGVAP